MSVRFRTMLGHQAESTGFDCWSIACLRNDQTREILEHYAKQLN